MAAVGVLAVALLANRCALVIGSLPYPGHEDEAFLTSAGLRIVQTGDPNPRFFRYPSLPVYLTAGGVSLGARLHDVDVATLDGGWRPFYDDSRVWVVPRLIFVLLGVASVWAVGRAASAAYDAPSAWVVAPWILAVSSFTQWTSWSYLNVDILAATAAAVAVAYATATWERRGSARVEAWGGAFCAVATACKYSMGVTLAGFALRILATGDRKVQRLSVLVSAFVGVFLLLVPYSALDGRLFLADVRAEADHYRFGHAGAEGPAGLPQLAWYGSRLVDDYGVPLVALGALGIVGLIARGRGKGMALLVVTAGLLGALSLQRVHFQRNALLLHVLWAAFAAGGAVAAVRWGSDLLAAVVPRPGRRASPMASLVLALLAAVGAPWQKVGAAYRPAPDSRHEVVAWLEGRGRAGGTILYPERLSIDLRPLPGEFRVVPLGPADRAPDVPTSGAAYFLATEYDRVSAGPDSEKAIRDWELVQERVLASRDARVVAEFGSARVHVDYVFPARYDPVIRVVDLRGPIEAP